MIESPTTIEQAIDLVRQAADGTRTIEIAGGRTRHGLGRPVIADTTLSTSKLHGITLYEPAELVMSARSGTPVTEIVAVLEEHGQMLAFEPLDHSMLYGSSGQPTIGGVFSTNASGPRRLTVGAARDHLLGIQLINGRAEIIRAGGRVMKNVTGIDVAKLVCGAMGTLGVLTEVTFKVAPRPEASATLIIPVASVAQAVSVMTRAMGSPFDVSGAAYLPDGRVLLRLEGFAESVDYRTAALNGLLAQGGQVERDEASRKRWRCFQTLSALDLSSNNEVWRISVAPSKILGVTTILPSTSRWMLDWSGGLLWLAVDDPIDALLRNAVGNLGGHATLIRANPERRARADVFMPISPVVSRIIRGIKLSIDPKGVFNPGRMYEGI